MASAGEAYVAVVLNLAAMLRNHIRGGPCRVYIADMKVRIESVNAFYYPDLFVTCNPADSQENLSNADWYWWSRYCPTLPRPSTGEPSSPITSSLIRCRSTCSSSRNDHPSMSSAAPPRGVGSCIRLPKGGAGAHGH